MAYIIIVSIYRRLYKEKKQSRKWKHSRKVTRRNLSLHKRKLRQVTRSEITFSYGGREEEEEEQEEEEQEAELIVTAHSVNADNEGHT